MSVITDKISKLPKELIVKSCAITLDLPTNFPYLKLCNSNFDSELSNSLLKSKLHKGRPVEVLHTFNSSFLPNAVKS